MPEAHSSVVGGSSAGRLMACPASYALSKTVKEARLDILFDAMEKGGLLDNMDDDQVDAALDAAYREQTTSPYADEGSALHEVMETILDRELDGAGIAALIGRKFYKGYLTLTQDLYEECIKPALEMFDSLLDDLEEQGETDFEVLVENKVEIPGIPGAFGTCDVIVKTSHRTLIVDWKFGGGVIVSAYENKQGMFYGRGALSSMPQMFGVNPPSVPEIKESEWPVDIVIIQPRVAEKPSRWTTTVRDLERFRMDLIAKVVEAQSPGAKFAEGDHCKFCPALPECPEKLRGLKKLADLKKDFDSEEKANRPLNMGNRLPELMDLAEAAEPFIEAIRKRAKEDATIGMPPSGWKLVQGNRRTKWGGDEVSGWNGKMHKLLNSRNIPTADFFPRRTITPKQAQTLLKKAGLKALPASYFEETRDQPKLVREDHAGAEYKPPLTQLKDVAEKISQATAEDPAET